jgi:hypothetical protein
VRPHTFLPDPGATDQPDGEPRCVACELPRRHRSHDVPERTDEEREHEARRMGEADTAYDQTNNGNDVPMEEENEPS